MDLKAIVKIEGQVPVFACESFPETGENQGNHFWDDNGPGTVESETYEKLLTTHIFQKTLSSDCP